MLIIKLSDNFITEKFQKVLEIVERLQSSSSKTNFKICIHSDKMISKSALGQLGWHRTDANAYVNRQLGLFWGNHYLEVTDPGSFEQTPKEIKEINCFPAEGSALYVSSVTTVKFRSRLVNANF